MINSQITNYSRHYSIEHSLDSRLILASRSYRAIADHQLDRSQSRARCASERPMIARQFADTLACFCRAELGSNEIQITICKTRLALIALGVILAGAPFLFSIRHPGDGQTILIAVDAEDNFYHAGIDARPLAGARMHSTVRAVVREVWPWLTPSVRPWIRFFDDYDMEYFSGECAPSCPARFPRSRALCLLPPPPLS